MFLRLRQLCLVAQDLEPVVADLCALFDEPVCHRDPAVGRFGLHNAIVALGSSFIEVVAPLQEGTAAGRYLQRRGGDGGYMVILDSESLPRWRSHFEGVSVRVANAYTHDVFAGLQLHPSDTGGALLEVNATQGGSADLSGPYGPAGPDWQPFVRAKRVLGVTAAVLQSAEPEQLAQRWGQILQRPVQPLSASESAQGWSLALDSGALHFVPLRDARGQGLQAIVLACRDVDAILTSARQRGCPVHGHSVTVGGVEFQLVSV